MRPRRGLKKYQIGGLSFTSQRAVSKWMNQIRQSYQDGETISDPAHVAAISDLLLHHKERLYLGKTTAVGRLLGVSQKVGGNLSHTGFRRHTSRRK